MKVVTDLELINERIKNLPNERRGGVDQALLTQVSECLDKLSQIHEFSNGLNNFLDSPDGKNPAMIAHYIIHADLQSLMEARSVYNDLQNLIKEGGPELSNLLNDLRPEGQLIDFNTLSAAIFQRPHRLGLLLQAMIEDKPNIPPIIDNPSVAALVKGARTRISAINRYQEVSGAKA